MACGGRGAALDHLRRDRRNDCRQAREDVAHGIAQPQFHAARRGEFSIIIANLTQAGGLLALLQPFAALYVLILASAAPLPAKESELIYGLFAQLFSRPGKRKTADEEVEEAQV